MHYLYKITNTVNEKIYIGQTMRLAGRWYEHRRNASNPTYPIHYAIKKYGAGIFIFEHIACCLTQNDANYLEVELIKQYDCFVGDGKGYNATRGGLQNPMTDEIKQKMSASLKARWARDGHPMVGRHHSEETLAKMRQPKSEETKQKISEAHTGKILTEEHKKAIGDGCRGKCGGAMAPASIEKMKATKLAQKEAGWKRKSHPMSEETKRKISETKKRKLIGLKSSQC